MAEQPERDILLSNARNLWGDFKIRFGDNAGVELAILSLEDAQLIAALEAKCARYEAAYPLADPSVPKYSPSATLIRAVLEGASDGE